MPGFRRSQHFFDIAMGLTSFVLALGGLVLLFFSEYQGATACGVLSFVFLKGSGD